MAKFRGDRTAFGWPGAEPRWTHGNKDGVGTAHSPASRVWFTLSRGALSEVYFPTVDRAQLRDLQFFISDGRSFCHAEKKHLRSETQVLSEQALGYRVINTAPDDMYRITKEIISDPVLPCVLQRVRLEPGPGAPAELHMYAFASPRLGGGGWSNNGYVVEVAGRDLLVAERNGVWLAMGATVPFVRLSCGYMGQSDGWTDLSDNFRLDWIFDRALEGHIALTGELDLRATRTFVIGTAFGDSLQSAVVALFQALGTPFDDQREVFLNQWHRAQLQALPLDRVAGDSGFLYRRSHSLLRSHEDKTFPGALIASLSIPWGEASGDDNAGGYHLVWTRDMVNSAMGLLAGGDTETPFRALIYLAGSQQADGGFPQNFWINGEPHWRGIQLDEVAFPILLAWRLKQEGALGTFDPYELVMRAAAYLIRHGPATQQERWEEASGYSPSTLAVSIAALICAACLARDRHDEATAAFLEAYADFLEGHLEAWTVTTQGTLVPGISRHYIRIMPVDVTNASPDEDPNQGLLYIANRPPGTQVAFPARDIVDAGFLELVRYGIRRPDDPLVVDSLRVVDAVLKVETPSGPAWLRYNHDGYGQKADGGPYTGWGQGRAWPLLTGERAHYELAAGADVVPFVVALERFATATGMLPEQVWDEADRPARKLWLGRPTGSAMPLMWAHAEYIKLLRSTYDGRVFDLIDPVHQRYCIDRSAVGAWEVWKPDRRPRQMAAGATLRIQAEAPFRLRWTADGWQTVHDTYSTATALGFAYVDLPSAPGQVQPFQFTFFWVNEERWEGADYNVAIAPTAVAGQVGGGRTM
ncbi:MAG: glycoside hydrolase 15-related [Symbiobacteriaceae bacterium]|jgi:glucoamylase|nr:glycoside hydrolase 15-related [Symbiobacteriaceae bacterium]